MNLYPVGSKARLPVSFLTPVGNSLRFLSSSVFLWADPEGCYVHCCSILIALNVTSVRNDCSNINVESCWNDIELSIVYIHFIDCFLYAYLHKYMYTHAYITFASLQIYIRARKRIYIYIMYRFLTEHRALSASIVLCILVVFRYIFLAFVTSRCSVALMSH